MWTFKRIIQEAFDTGGLLLSGLGCLFLYRQQCYPSVLGPLSFGMISVGALGFVRHVVKDLGSSIESSQYQEIILLLEQRQSEIEANRCMLEELRDVCSRFMAMREILEAWQGDPSLTEEQASILAKVLQPRDVATSVESAQETPSDVQLEPLADGCSSESKIFASSEEDVGVVKLDVQPEQTGRNPKTLKDQALQVHSNISASLQCHATEKHQKEETKQYSEITDESKQEDPENIREMVTEKDMKQEDRVLKDMENSGYDGVEYKPEDIENLTKNDVQPEQTGKNPKTLKEQALQVQSNISASLQCHAAENHRKEETKIQHLQITDESKQQYPENICEMVTEKDMKQEDRVLKDMGQSGYDGVEYKPGEIQKLSENDAQPEKEELQRKESGELNSHEGRSEDIASKEIQMTKEKNEEEFLKEGEQVI